jgi:hypothetical protein
MHLISKIEAKEAGLKLYFTGLPCVNGGISWRRTSSNACVCDKCKELARASARESMRRMRALDRDAYLAEKKRYRESNRDQLLDKQRARRLANIETDRQRKRDYRKLKPEVNHASLTRYRASKAKATPSWDREFDDFVTQEASNLCRLRREVTGIAWEIDHMIPLRAVEACGLHVGLNLQVIPAWMNNSKKNRMMYTQPGDWLK